MSREGTAAVATHVHRRAFDVDSRISEGRWGRETGSSGGVQSGGKGSSMDGGGVVGAVVVGWGLERRLLGSFRRGGGEWAAVAVLSRLEWRGGSGGGDGAERGGDGQLQWRGEGAERAAEVWAADPALGVLRSLIPVTAATARRRLGLCTVRTHRILFF